MSIRRSHLAFEDHYVQVPNRWVRDQRLSRKARGLLVELMSHRAGWDITIESLVRDGSEGRDAIRSAVGELEDCGYLEREQSHDTNGRFGNVDYVIVDPWEWGADNPTSVQPTTGNPPTKKTIPTEDHPQETPPTPSTDDDAFEALWKAWPNKSGKKAARTAWRRITTGEKHRIVVPTVAHANAHRQHTPPQYIPMLSTFLNGERWSDPLAVSRERGAYKPEPNANKQQLKIPQGHVPVRDELTGQIIGSRPA